MEIIVYFGKKKQMRDCIKITTKLYLEFRKLTEINQEKYHSPGRKNDYCKDAYFFQIMCFNNVLKCSEVSGIILRNGPVRWVRNFEKEE